MPCYSSHGSFSSTGNVSMKDSILFVNGNSYSIISNVSNDQIPDVSCSVHVIITHVHVLLYSGSVVVVRFPVRIIMCVSTILHISR